MEIELIVKAGLPKNRQGELRAGVDALRAEGHAVREQRTSRGADAAQLAAAAAGRGAELVIAVGGDGTVNGVVNGITTQPHWPRVGLVPAGTANDFAKGLELPQGFAEALAVAVRGRVAEIDVACVNERRFVNVSTGGFGTGATRRAKGRLKRVLGPVAYAVHALKQLRGYEPSRARFEVDGERVFDGAFAFYAVGNSWRTGGGMQVTPEAQLNDARLDLVIVRHMERAELVKLLPQLRAGTHLEHPEVLYARGARVAVSAASALPVNADGEALSARTLCYRVLPRRLELMVKDGSL